MELNYTPNLTGLTIVTDQTTQRNLVFHDGHPRFLIPDFNPEPTDIWLSYEDYIEKVHGPIYDQNGGEIVSYLPIGTNGLMKVEYVLDDLSLESDEDNYKQYNITIEGYVVSDGYFLATKVTGDYNMKTFTRSEITNKHGQRIYMFAKRPGNTELEKCIDLITHMKVPFQRFDTQTITGDSISIIFAGSSGRGGFEVFNSLGEKVGEGETDYIATSTQDMSDDLNDLGFTI